MGGGGSNNGPQATQFTDTAGLQQWVNSTTQGAQYKATLAQQGNTPFYSTPNGWQSNPAAGPGASNEALTAMLDAYSGWTSAQNNAQQTWQNYATRVGQQAGGQGQSTILGSPTQPTSAIGQAAGVNRMVGKP
jgi:hypothetical protein